MADRQTKALMLYLNNREVLEALDDAERGRMTLALMDYLESGTLPAFTGAMQMAFIVLRKDVDRSEARWNEECARRSAAGKKSAAVRAAKNFTQEVSCENDSEEAESDSPSSNAAEPGAAALNSLPSCSTNLSSVQPCSTALSSVQHGSTDATYTNTNTNSNTNTNANTNTKIRNQSLSADFERFWQAYPRKVGKQAARRAFARADVSLQRLLEALEQQKADPQWQRENGRYIPHPVTWLNQGRWEDEPAGAPAPCERFRVESL